MCKINLKKSIVMVEILSIFVFLFSACVEDESQNEMQALNSANDLVNKYVENEQATTVLWPTATEVPTTTEVMTTTQLPTTTQPPTTTQQPTTQEIQYSVTIIGNKNSKAYHLSSCSRLPKEKNRIYFNSEEEANAAGYNNPCDYCCP